LHYQPQAYGSGFSLSEQNAIGLGSAFAGAAAVVEKASTIYSNPAGMVHVKGQQLSFAIHAINPSSCVQNTGSVKAVPAPLGNEGGDIGDLAFKQITTVNGWGDFKRLNPS
jgi:long-chain fatty acid transport protein